MTPARVRRAATAVLALAIAGLALTGCATRAASSSPPTTGTPTATASAGPGGAATALLETAVLPEGATAEKQVIAKPYEQAACTHLIDAHKSWSVPNTDLASITSFLEHHPTPTLKYTGDGTATDHGVATSAEVDETGGKSTVATLAPELLFTFAPGAGGSVDIRVDSFATTAASKCTSSQPAG
jgi:hypothetical protein